MGKSERLCRIFHVVEAVYLVFVLQLIIGGEGASRKLAKARVVLQHYVVILPWSRFVDDSCLGSQIPVSSLEYLALWYTFQPPAYLLDLVEPKQSPCLRHSITAFLCLAMCTRRKQCDASGLFFSIEDFSLKPFRHSVHRIYIADPER